MTAVGYRIKERPVVGGATYYVVVDDAGNEPSGFEHGTRADAEREIERLQGSVEHRVTTFATAFGWTWACACGKQCSGVGSIRTQTAAYSAGERHIARERPATWGAS